MPKLRHTARFPTSFFAPCNYGSLSIGARFRHRIFKKRWQYLINFIIISGVSIVGLIFFPPTLLLSSLVTLLLFSDKRASREVILAHFMAAHQYFTIFPHPSNRSFKSAHRDFCVLWKENFTTLKINLFNSVNPCAFFLVEHSLDPPWELF